VVLRKNLQNAGSGGGGGDNRLDETCEQFINSTISYNTDNGNVKHVAKVAYPGQAKQVIANKTGITRIVEVGPFDEPITKFRSDPLSEEDHRSMENIARDKIKIEQKQLSDLSSKTVTSNVDLDSKGDREIIVKILPDFSNSTELALSEDRRFVLESNVKDKETLDLKSKAGIASIGLDSGETIIKIQSGQSISKEISEDCKSIMESVTKGKTEVEQREVLRSKINIADTDLGSDTGGEVIVKVQPGPSNTSEMIPKEPHKSTVKSITTDKIEIGQKEILDLRSKTKSANINLGLADDGGTKQIQPSQSSTELRLRECCWPIRENTADDKIEICDRNIIATKEIFYTGLYLDDSSIVASKKTIDNESTDQFNLNKIEPEKYSMLTKETDDASSKEINVKKKITDVKLSSVETDNVVKVQPAHSSHNIIITKGGNHKLMTEKLTDAEITFEEKRNRCKEDLKLSNADENETLSAKLDLEKIVESSVKIDDTEIKKFKKEIADFGVDKVRDPETRATTLNISAASLNGRNKCALSDSDINKEDYRLSQYRSSEEGKKEKFLRTAESNSTKHADNQRKDLTDTTDSTDDNKISAKKDDTRSDNSRVLIDAVIQSYKEKLDHLTTEEANNRAKSVEETHQLEVTEQRLSSGIETNDKVNVENREQTRVLEEIKKTSDTEKASELDAYSSERRIVSCDPNLEIDGKYLKSIVNSRKSPRKIKEGQIHDIEYNKEQHQTVIDNQQVLPSEEFQSSSMKVKIFEKLEKNHVSDANIDTEKNDRIIDDQETFRVKEIFQDTSKMVSTKTQSIRKIDEFHIGSQDKHEFKNQDKSVNDREASRAENVFQSPPRSISTKAGSFKETDKFQISESERESQHQDKSISDREIYRSEKASQKPSRTSSAKSPRKIKKSQIIYRSDEMKDYDRSINDRVISQLEEVFQDLSSKKPLVKLENPKVDHESYIETRKQNRSVDNREASRSEEFPQRLSKTSSLKSPRKTQEQKSVKMHDEKAQQEQEKMRETKSADIKTKLDFNEIKDVYTRKVRRYNVPLQGSLDSMIVSDESNVQKPKKDDAFSKKSKSYESIKRIQEVFLGVPPSKANSSGSQLDIPDEFCSICCYMNEITFRTEEEISSPNQETFYTLRSACSSLADDDDSIECDICESLNLQEPIDDLDGKVQEIPCELCRICSEVDGTYEQNPALTPDRYAFKVVKSQRDDDDSFEIENCGFQNGTESADDRGKISEKEKIKDAERPKSQSLFIHGSSIVRDQPRELYFIPKDEIAILTSGARRIGRKGSLFRKKEDLGGSARDNRRYSSVDSLQLAKISKANDKMLKTTKDPTLVGSADNLISRDSRRSKSLQRSADNVKCLNSSADNLLENLRKEDEAEGSARKSSIRDKEAVKMILTQHGIKIISEKETAL